MVETVGLFRRWGNPYTCSPGVALTPWAAAERMRISSKRLRRLSVLVGRPLDALVGNIAILLGPASFFIGLTDVTPSLVSSISTHLAPAHRQRHDQNDEHDRNRDNDHDDAGAHGNDNAQGHHLPLLPPSESSGGSTITYGAAA